MRHAWLLDHAVARAERDLRLADHERDLPAEHGDVVERPRRVRLLEPVTVRAVAALPGCISVIELSPGAISTILKQAPPGGGSSSQARVEVSERVTAGGVPSLTQTSVVRYRPALITVGGAPSWMIAGWPASS